MRFGIMAMQLGLILPARAESDPQALALALAHFDASTLVSRLADAGLGLIELNTDLELFLPGCFGERPRRSLAAMRQRRGLAYTAHLPLWSLEPSTPDERVRNASLAALVDAARRLAELEPEVFVLHATGALAAEFSRMPLPPAARSTILARFQEQARRSLAALTRATGLPPRRIALENVDFPLELTLDLAEEFDCSLCLDTGHLLAGYSGDGRFEDAVERMLPRLGEVHLHDGYRRGGRGARPETGDHLRLGAGDMPLAWFLDRLAAHGFAGPVVLELSIDDALASLAEIGGLRPGLLRDERL